jgi:dTDP-6-deoxy-L-talose 4-dehydrogenase (NAD+)
MKVLVTGATGFVGRHVVAQLLARGHEVVAVSRDKDKARAITWFERVRFIACDIHDAVDAPFERFGRPDAVMHLAWPGLPNYDALVHYEKALPADYRFLKALVHGGARHLLVTGTCAEYGMQSGALAEQLPTAPANPYALAKDTLRKQLQSLQQQHAFALQWARLFYMHGEGQNPSSLLAQLDRAIDGGESVFNMSGGEQLRDYLPVQEVAARTVTLLEHPDCAGVVNICSGEPISVRRLVERHLAQRGASIRLNLGHYPYSREEPMAFWGDASRLAGILQRP